MLSHKTIVFHLLVLWLATISVWAQSGPIEISNDGEIKVDQASDSISIEENVEVHQAPIYLHADKVIWKKGEKQLLATGNIRVSIDTTEAKDEQLHPFLLESVDAKNQKRVQILQTDKLIFDSANKTIQPEGDSNIQIGFARIIGSDLNLNLESNTIQTGNYRVGFSDLFLEGDSLTAEGANLFAENAHFFIGEPDAFSIQGHARSVEKKGEDRVILKGLRLQLGPIPFFYWPYYEHTLGRQLYSISGSVGYSGDIGAYTELRPTYHPTDNLKFFNDFNFYSERGVMFGPGFNLTFDASSNHVLHTKLETGYIRDNGALGHDILGEAIDGERHYIDFEFLHRYKDSIQILGRVERWSDSEILQDFSPGKFRSIQQPQTFLELNGLWGPVALSLTTHIRHEAFEYATERSPEVSLQLLPTPISNTGLYHSANVTGSKLHNSNPNNPVDLDYSRLRSYYQLLYPIALTSWLDLTPQATAQYLDYSESGMTEGNNGFTHLEAGFDLTAYTHGVWDLQNEIWDIHGIRHILNPTLQYRRIEAFGTDLHSVLPIEAKIFNTGVNDIDLTSNTFLDELDSYSLIRIGIQNSIVAKGKNGGIRELVDFDLFHDLYIPEDKGMPTAAMLSLDLQLNPAQWLQLTLQSRFKTDTSWKLNDMFARLQLFDGDIWDLDLASQFVSDNLEQYLLMFRYKISENWRFVSEVGYDTRKSLFYEQTYGLQFGIANYWDLFVAINFREGSTRSNETRFELKLRASRF